MLSPSEVAAVVRAPLACWFSPQLYERGLANEVALLFKRSNNGTSRPRQIFDALATSGLAPRQMIMPAVSLASSGQAFAAFAATDGERKRSKRKGRIPCWGITFQMIHSFLSDLAAASRPDGPLPELALASTDFRFDAAVPNLALKTARLLNKTFLAPFGYPPPLFPELLGQAMLLELAAVLGASGIAARALFVAGSRL